MKWLAVGFRGKLLLHTGAAAELVYAGIMLAFG